MTNTEKLACAIYLKEAAMGPDPFAARSSGYAAAYGGAESYQPRPLPTAANPDAGFNPNAGATPAPALVSAPHPAMGAPPSPSPQASRLISAPVSSGGSPASPSSPDFNAMFKKYHGSSFNPNSKMDAFKMKQLQQAHAGGTSLLSAANIPYNPTAVS